METITIPVKGMSCNGCASSLKGLFDKTAGVQAAEVSFDASQAVLTYDPAQIDRAGLEAVIDKAGFEVG